jgi:hypothetical protein
MIPHISFTEMLQAATFVFVAGMITGGYIVHKLTRKK